ncbi:MAG: GNAT family N-acetyltransferase [Ruminococcus sp.]|nr:GNAT family N-acetyltransferase [Ruminococcus sp.]
MNENPVGYFGVCLQKDGSLFLSKLYLKKEFRGKGLARIEFNAVLQIAKTQKAPIVWLTVNKHNMQAIAIYKHFGINCIRSQITNIGNSFFMDDYVFSLILEK